MIKSELVLAIHAQFPELQLRDVEMVLNCILNQMGSSLARGERIEIRGFGCFGLRHRPPRLARNPKTGESVHCLAKVGVYFKPGKEMRVRADKAHDKYGIIK